MYKYLKVYHSPKLAGEVPISGAKNSALPLMAVTILSNRPVKLTNLPGVADVKTMGRLLENLGAGVEIGEGYGIFDTSSLTGTTAVYEIVKTMRASILVLGPLLGRFGNCRVSLPGGCAIGARPVNLHIKALQQMGADIKIEQGYICAEGRLKGAELFFDQITVTGSENIIMAAAMAKGKSRILNVAQEPEVLQLCNTLKEAGVDIQRVGEREWEIVGTDGELIPIPDTHIIPDRIEAGTYLAAGAITNSQLSVVDVIPGDLEPVLAKFREMGYRLEVEKDKITIYPAQTIQPVQIVTAPHPEFPTDMQAQFMAIATQADGVSLIEERLFENRFMHVQELNRLGANIVIRGKVASVYGPTPLVGADVMATDLRASSALVLAGLIAKGETRVHRIYHLFRGYEKLIEKFRNIGAKMEIGEEPRP